MLLCSNFILLEFNPFGDATFNINILMLLLCLCCSMTLALNFQVVFWTCFWSLSLLVFQSHNTFYVEEPRRTQHTLDMSMGYTWPINKKLGSMHYIMFTWYPMWNRHLLTTSPLFSRSNYTLSLHGKKKLYDYQTLSETNALCWNSCLPYKYNVPLST